MIRSILILTLLVVGCSQSPEQIAAQKEREAEQQKFVLEQTCIRKHGSPVKKEDGSVACNYPWSIHINK